MIPLYNRYVPQPDGSYRKNRVQEPRRPNPPDQRPAPPPPPKQRNCPQQQETCRHPVQDTRPPSPPPKRHGDSRQNHGNQDSILGFFKQLLPKDMDTGDLLIILLLLLMAGDCEEDRNNALLTLALYFFM